MSSSRGSKVVEQYSLHIQGLPLNYDWKDLKDLVRQKAQHGIRGDVYEQTANNGRRTKIGMAKVNSRSEAINLYNWLISGSAEGRQHVVHLFDASGASAVLMASNCTTADCAGCARAASASRSSLAPTWSSNSSSAPLRGSAHIPNMTAMSLVNGMHGMQIADSRSAPSRPAMRQTAATPFSYIATPEGIQPCFSSPTSSKLPINTRDGFVRTEARGIFIQGLDFKIRQDEVEALFSKAGTIRKCTLQTDSRGKSKGTARVEYATMAEAQLAVQTFSDWKWHSRVLKIRLDKEEFVVSDTADVANSSTRSIDAAKAVGVVGEPLIVNGSGARIRAA